MFLVQVDNRSANCDVLVRREARQDEAKRGYIGAMAPTVTRPCATPDYNL